MEHMAHKEMQNYQMQLDKQKYMMEMEKKNMQNTIQMQEVEQERERRQRRSKQFQFNNVSLHNPITNPIEYHIDNPYILKKIQDRTLGWDFWGRGIWCFGWYYFYVDDELIFFLLVFSFLMKY